MGLLFSSLLPRGNPPLSVAGQVKHPGVPDGEAYEPTKKEAAMRKRREGRRYMLQEGVVKGEPPRKERRSRLVLLIQCN